MKCSTYETLLADNYWLRCQLHRDRSEDADSPYVSTVSAVIFCKTEQPVGYFDGFVVHLTEIALEGEDLFCECDRHSQTLSDVYGYLLSEGRPLDPSPKEGVTGDLFHMDQLLINPGHRGKNLGLSACASLMTLMQSDCAYASMKPFPLQWNNKVEGNEPQYERDLAKLISHYQPLAFTATGGSGGFFYRKLHRKEKILRFSGSAWSKIRHARLPVCPKWAVQ